MSEVRGQHNWMKGKPAGEKIARLFDFIMIDGVYLAELEAS